MTIDQDLEFISNSLRMLPPWDWDDDTDWWPQFAQRTGLSKQYLTEKLAWITRHWRQGPRENYFAHDRAQYVLMFFDNPDLYEHLDAVAGTWDSQVPGKVGQRWSEGICAAAWRVLVAAEPDNVYSHNFSVPEVAD